MNIFELVTAAVVMLGEAALPFESVAKTKAKRRGIEYDDCS